MKEIEINKGGKRKEEGMREKREKNRGSYAPLGVFISGRS